MPAQNVRGVRLTAPNDGTTYTDISINIGAQTGPVSFFAVAAVNGASSSVSVTSISINGTPMALEADRSMAADLGTPGRWRAAKLDGVTVSGAITLEVIKSGAVGRTNVVLLWSDQSTGVINVAFVPYATGGTQTYAFSASVVSNSASQAVFAGLFNAATSVTPSSPTTIPQHASADAIGLLNGSTELRLGAFAEPGASSSVLQATLVHTFSAGGIGWVASFSGAGAPGPNITSQPGPQVVVDGGTANFAVDAAASGGGTLSYQWRKDGVPIGGATSASYARTAVLADSGAQFSAVVVESGGTNPGTVNSANALLTVNPSSGTFSASFPAGVATDATGSTKRLSQAWTGYAIPWNPAIPAAAASATRTPISGTSGADGAISITGLPSSGPFMARVFFGTGSAVSAYTLTGTAV
jgi:hypothetical protein